MNWRPFHHKTLAQLADFATTVLSFVAAYALWIWLRQHFPFMPLGADVPFFLEPKPSIARGIGEVLEPIARWPELWYLTVTPRFQVSTAWVYGNLRLGLTSNEYGRIKDRLGKESLVISQFLENDLESVTSVKFPMLDRIKKTLLDAGAEGALMTGSGPTVFGVFGSRKQAEQAGEKIVPHDFGMVLVAGSWKKGIIEH